MIPAKVILVVGAAGIAAAYHYRRQVGELIDTALDNSPGVARHVDFATAKMRTAFAKLRRPRT